MSDNRYKRQIAVGDLHGVFRLVKDLVERKIRFTEHDQLIFVGDYIDRCSQSKEVVDYVKALKEKYPDQIILLKGNHEDMAEQALSSIKDPDYFSPIAQWLINGGQATIDSYGGVENCKKELLPFIKELELFYETDTLIFVHGGIPEGKSLRTATPYELMWERDLDYDGEKTLVVGHSVHSQVVIYKNIIAVDTGACFTGKLSGYDVINDEIYVATENQKSVRR